MALAVAGSAMPPDAAAPAPAGLPASQSMRPHALAQAGTRYFAPSWHDPATGWEPAPVEGFDVLLPDDAPLALSRYVPAGGPAQRHTSRPGAWYTAVFLPMLPGWPVQVWITRRARTHELRVIALDASPSGAASVAVPVPLRTAPGARRAALATAPIMLPATSRADGVFLLIEQWSPAGDRPAPLWVQARTRIHRDDEQVPWWQPLPAPDEGSHAGRLAPNPPASPLSAPRHGTDVVELPILRRRHAP